MTPLPLTYHPDNGTPQFLIDASTLEGQFMKCPRAYYYHAIKKRESSGFPAGRTFGSILHDHCLAPYYKGEAVNVDAAIAAMPEVMRTGDDYRNAGYLKELWQKYVATFPLDLEPFKHDPQAVELPFTCKIGTLRLIDVHTGEARYVDVIWTGKIDLPVDWDGTPSPLDHKTSSIGGESVWEQFANSTQQLGYVWTLQQLLQTPVREFTINLILTRRSTAKGLGIEFLRRRFPVEPEIVAEFPGHILSNVQHLFDCAERNVWPMHTSQCVGKYGRCEYLPVCKACPAQRETTLATGLYTDVTWSPLKK